MSLPPAAKTACAGSRFGSSIFSMSSPISPRTCCRAWRIGAYESCSDSREVSRRDNRAQYIANRVQRELWGNGPYPPRTIVEVHRSNQYDIMELRKHSTRRPESTALRYSHVEFCKAAMVRTGYGLPSRIR